MLAGSGPALVIGVVLALWAGLGVMLALNRAFDRVWGVPHVRRRHYFAAVPKTLVRFVIRWVANERASTWVSGDPAHLREVLFSILDTPISPELTCSSPAITMSSVVLPEPEGPTMPTASPALTVRSTPRRISNARRLMSPRFPIGVATTYNAISMSGILA